LRKGLVKMSIIKELDEWLKDSESRSKLINFNEGLIKEITIIFIKEANLSRINISIVKFGEEITNFNFYMDKKKTSATSLLRCAIHLASYNAQALNNAIDDIKNCIGGEE
jgi:hypothetical protein